MLTAEQISYFETFGFLVMRQYFSTQETDAITREFDELIETDRKGKPFEGKERQAVSAFVEKSPSLMPLLEDDRIYEPSEQLLGPDFVWSGSGGNLYVGDSGWHSDDSVPGYDRIKIEANLDPVTKDTGCLRVIPGSHRLPLHGDLKRLRLKRTEPSLLAFGVKGADMYPHIPWSLSQGTPGSSITTSFTPPMAGGRVAVCWLSAYMPIPPPMSSTTLCDGHGDSSRLTEGRSVCTKMHS